MDWSVVGGNPVPVEVAAILGAARVLRGTLNDVQRWRLDTLGLLRQADPEWSEAGCRTVQESTVWDARLAAAASALTAFAGQVERLRVRASELALRARAYSEELRSLRVADWYDFKFEIGVPPSTGNEVRSLNARLSAVRSQVEQVRIDYARAERQLVAVLAQQLGRSVRR